MLSFIPTDNVVSWGRMQKCMLITDLANRKRVLAPITWAEELMIAVLGVD